MRKLSLACIGLVAGMLALGSVVPDAKAVTCPGAVFQGGNLLSCAGAVENTIYDGNTPKDSLNGSLSLWKVDLNPLSTTPGSAPGDYSNNFTVSFPDNLTVNWAFSGPDAGELTPTMMAIKAGNFWYFIALSCLAAVDNCSATQNQILNPPGNAFLGISHVVFYDGLSQVPLPPALLLFGTALVGLGVLGRRRKKVGMAQQA